MLSEKVCIVAGGGRGIGRASAVNLGRHGATVVVNDLGVDVEGGSESSEPAEETVDAVEEVGGTGMAHYGDISSLEYTERLVSDVVEEYGRVDGAANFAGILRDGISYKLTGDDWDSVMNVHLRGHFALLRNLGVHWRERARDEGGELNAQRSFLGASSRAAMGNVGQANYSAAKAGILGLVRTTSRELAQYNIRVNSLMPSAFTRMVERIPEEKRWITEEELPPEKVAPLVSFVMSDAAEDISGVTLRASGDTVGIVSDPEITRLGYAEGGWTLDALTERFKEDIANETELDRTGVFD